MTTGIIVHNNFMALFANAATYSHTAKIPPHTIIFIKKTINYPSPPPSRSLPLPAPATTPAATLHLPH